MQSTYELVIDDDAGMTTIVPLYQAEVSIGRKTGNFIKLSERNISRHHARLVRAGEQLGIEDLGSYTGVLVNGQRIARPTTIDAGDQVQIGDYRLALRRVAVAAGQQLVSFPAPTKVVPVLPAGTTVPPVEKTLPAAPTEPMRPKAALPLGPNPGSARRRSWGITLGAALTTMVGGLVYFHHVAVSEIAEQAAPPARTVQAAVRPRDAVRTIPSTPQPNQETVVRKAAPAPAPLAPSVLRSESSHHRESHRNVGHVTPSVDSPSLSEEQAAKLLAQAQTHYVNGDFAETIRLARKLQTSQGVEMTRAWRILGAAACKLGELALINEAYRHVDAVSRQYMTYVCQQSGVTLSSGHFIQAH